MNHWKTKAARAGSTGGDNSLQLLYTNTTGRPAQPHVSLPDRRATTNQRAVQLRLFALDGAWAEPYIARANSKAAKAVGRGGRRWL